MERLVGWLFVGTTVLLASMDGALLALIFAAIAGGTAYATLVGVGDNRGIMNKALDTVYQKIKDTVDRAVAAAPEKDREALKKAAQKKFEELDKTKCFDEAMNKRAGALAAVAVFASPVLIAAVIAYLLRDKINVTAVVDEVSDAVTPNGRTLTGLANQVRV